MLRHAKPTGKRRYRVQPWTGKLILQLQFAGMITSHSGGMVDTMNASAWRDAKITDITIDEAHEAGSVHTEYLG